MKKVMLDLMKVQMKTPTTTQMKMFLTRFGFNSKVIVTGDTTQVDLDKNIKSGLVESISLLKNISGIGFVNFNGNDIVRHPLVKEILEAYTKLVGIEPRKRIQLRREKFSKMGMFKD